MEQEVVGLIGGEQYSITPDAPVIPKRNFIRIVSVCPVPLSHHKMMSQDREINGVIQTVSCEVTFDLPAATRDGYSHLDIFDATVFHDDPSRSGPDQPESVRLGYPTPAIITAQALIQRWTDDRPTGVGGQIGIGMLMPPNSTRVPPGFLERLRQVQSQYALDYTTKANERYKVKPAEVFQNPVNYMWAEWLYGPRAGDYCPWYNRPTYNDYKKCLRCQAGIEMAALYCKHCHVDLVEYCDKLNLDPDDAAVKEALTRMRAASASRLPSKEEARPVPSIPQPPRK